LVDVGQGQGNEPVAIRAYANTGNNRIMNPGIHRDELRENHGSQKHHWQENQDGISKAI
jgi:hypothetical protein